MEANTISITSNSIIIEIDRLCSFTRTTEIPKILFGLSAIGQLKGRGIRARAEVLNATQTGMTLRASGWGFNLFRCDTSLMKLPNRPSLRFQSGQVSTNDLGPRNWDEKLIVDGAYVPECIGIKVIFPKEYSTPPKVMTWLTFIDIGYQDGVNHRVAVQVEGVTSQGCTIASLHGIEQNWSLR